MPKSSKRVALVTGGSRGIGLRDCRIAGRQRIRSGDQRRARGSRKSPTRSTALAKRGAEVHYCRGDVAVAADRQAIVDAVRSKFGRLDVLVNNAGVAPQRAGRYSRRDRRKLRPRDRHQSQRTVFSHAACRPLDGRAAEGRRDVPRRDCQHLVRQRDRSLDQPRRLLHQQGRHRDGHAALGPPAGRVRHSPSTKSGPASSTRI